MKKIILLLTTAILLASCMQQTMDEKAKRKKLQDLKQQVDELQTEIHTLETELSATQEQEIVDVKITPLHLNKFEHFIEVTGQVEAEQDVDVNPESAGVIKEVLVKEGQLVSKGQVMARLNTDLLERSKEELEVQLDLAVTNFERQKNLWDQKIGSEMQFLQAKNNKESLEKRIKSVDTQIEMTEVKSPINGIVDVVYQKKGHIGSPQIPFAKVINTSKIKIYADVSETYITKIHKGDTVSVNFPALDKEITTTVAQVGNSIDAHNRTFRIRLNLKNRDKMIKPNLVSIVKLRDYVNESAIVVPTLFVKEDFSGNYTYIIDKEKGKTVARKTYVTQGVSNNNLTEITDGLTEGMQIISEGYNQVANGTHVKIH